MRDWLAYYRALGVDRFFIGLDVFDDNAPRRVWQKKPFPELYHLDMSEVDCISRFMQAIQPFAGDIVLLPRSRGGDEGNDNRGYVIKLQLEFFEKVLNMVRSHYDWLVNVDVDEFILPLKHDSLRDMLDSVRSKFWIGEWKIRQKRFASRWDEHFRPIRVAENTRCHLAVQDWSPKYICRPNLVRRADVHYTETIWRARGAVLQDCYFGHFSIPANAEWKRQDPSKAGTIDGEDNAISVLRQRLGVWNRS